MSSPLLPQGPPQIPQSSALSEASAEGPAASLSELFSRDPEGLLRRDRDQIIEALRADRARREKAEAEGKGAKPRGAKVELSKIAPKSAGDMGL